MTAVECPTCHTPMHEGPACPNCGAVVPVMDDTLTEAARLRDAGMYAEAVSLCLTAIGADPKAKHNAPYYAFAAELYASQGNLQLAIECYRRAVYLQPTDANRARYDVLLDTHRQGVRPRSSTASASVPVPVAAPPAVTPVDSPTAADAPAMQYPEFERTRTVSLTQSLPPSPLPVLWRMFVTQRSRQVFVLAVIMVCISALLIWHPWQRHRRPPAKVLPITETAPTPLPAAVTPATPGTPAPGAPTRGRTRHHTRTAAPTPPPATVGQP